MTFPERVAEETLSWRGTPFVWGQSQKGVGCDCKGLLAGVARELGRPEAGNLYANFTGYRPDRPIPSDVLLEGFEKTFLPAKVMRPGYILLLKHGGKPGHMAIYVGPLTASGNPRAVHAFPGRKAEVCDRELRVLFHKFPLHSIWRWKR